MTPSNMLRVVRRGKFRYILITGIGLTLMVLLYQGFGGSNIKSVSVPSSGINDFKRENNNVINNNLDQADAPQVNKAGLSSLLWGWSASGKASTRPTDECRVIPKLKDVDIDTVEVYPTLNFKPSYKTYWNHTFEKRFMKQRETWGKLPLRVFVLPHSHNDPGWLKTFDGYFLSSTAYILNNMVNRLEKYPNMTFIWSEISFFAKWWDSLKNRPELRELVTKQVHRGQLEMVTGGWVMTDEAAAHYHAMVEQLVEGHQWLKTHLGVVPKNGWSIDPFGHSSTVPYLLRESGIDNMIIQRIHFAWKQYLAERKRLEFVWKQFFDKPPSNSDGKSKAKDVLCHMTPFDLYSIKHTCGPDTDVCLQFDFRRIAGEYSESTAVQINDDNIEQKSKLLLGQYGRIGSLFPHNVALVFLGDDFRFNHDVEWDQQYSNYQKIFDHVNGQKHLNAKLSFGTLDDYFKEVHARMEKLQPETFATLTGDFLPYGDIYAEARPSYWTGYFTTRPYWKHLTRELEHWLRSAEILYSLCRTLTKQRGNEKLLERLNQDYLYLTTARQSLGLFQHHDAITGTSKADVMNDYGRRLYRGIRESIGVISHSAQYVMLKEPIKTDADLRPAHPMTSYLFPDINRPSYDSFPQKVAFSIPRIEGRKIVVFNSALHRRQQVIRMMVKTPHVKVLDANNVELPSQVNPAWNGTIEIVSGIYELNFVIEMPPLALQTLTVMDTKHSEGQAMPETRPTVSVFVNDAFSVKPTASVFNFQNPSSEDIQLESPHLTAIFCKQTGLLKELKLKSDSEVRSKMTMSFQAYKSEDFRSGAYLFQANRAEPIVNVTGRFPVIRVVRGPIISEVHTVYPGVVSLTSRVYHVDGILGAGLELTTTFDMTVMQDTNLELFMRFETDIENGNVFYTDTNGFQIIKRYNMPKLPVEANYYPITSATYIEDAKTRLSLLVSHAHGSTSHKPGAMEVMLDRRLRYDDSRGLGEGVLDNKKTAAQFWLILEQPNNGENQRDNGIQDVPNLSLLGHTLSESLNYPPILLVAETGENRPMEKGLVFLEGGLPCDYHLVNLRTLPIENSFEDPSDNSLLILHRKGVSCHVTSPSVPYGCDAGPENLNKTGPNRVKLGLVRVQTIQKTSLTGMRTIEKLKSLGQVHVDPMNLQSYNVLFAP